MPYSARKNVSCSYRVSGPSPFRVKPLRAWALSPVASALSLVLLTFSLAPIKAVQARVQGAWFAQGSSQQFQQHSQAARQHAARISNTNRGSAQQRRAHAHQAQALENLGRTAHAIAAHQAAQNAARLVAMQQESNVVNGLAQGGLWDKDSNGNLHAWQGANRPEHIEKNGAHTVRITQTDAKAILNWDTFNVGRDTTVHFDQSAGSDSVSGKNTWSVLNRVHDPRGKPSEIAGRIKADGAVYLINRNGVVFTGSSQVNVRNLVAASLKLSDEQFKAGINVRLGTTQGEIGWVNGGSHHGIPTFGENPTKMSNGASIDTALESDPEPSTPGAQVGQFDPGVAPGHVHVHAGAQILGQEGHVLLFAPKVKNEGVILTPGGQTLLAAGENVWLEGDIGSRGLNALVSAVRPWTFGYGPVIGDRGYNTFEHELQKKVLPLMEQRAKEVGYKVVNTGLVQADHGDISLVSDQVLQAGILQASTALNNRGGSIRLRAIGQGMYAHSGGSDEVQPGFGHLIGWSAGTLTFSEDSITQVVSDWREASQIELTAVEKRYDPSHLEAYGRWIDIRSGARLTVSGQASQIEVQAASNPFHIINGNQRKQSAGDGSRILIGENAYLSAAGLLDMPVDMARNFVEADLRINELKDSFLQHGSWLYGKKVVVDRRVMGQFKDGPMAGVQWIDGKKGHWVGTPLADVSAWVGTGLVNLAELAARGGNILLHAGGAVLTRPGSVLDVSGGSIRFSDGWDTSTQLRGTDGRTYSISKAPADMRYVGIAGEYQRRSQRWGVTDTYRSALMGRARFESGYVQGQDAGAVIILAGGAHVLEGKIKGGVQIGDRVHVLSDLAQAGSFTLGGAGNDDRPWTPGRLILSHTPVLLPKEFSISSEVGGEFLDLPEREKGAAGAGRTTWLSDRMLSESGLGEINLYSTNDIEIQEGSALDLNPGTHFGVLISASDPDAYHTEVLGQIRAPGGRVFLGMARLGKTSVIDVSGQWINDQLTGTVSLARALAGGSVQIGLAAVEPGAIIDVSGGAWLPWSLNGAGRIQAGKGGSLSLHGFDAHALGSISLRAWSGADPASLTVRVEQGDVHIGGLTREKQTGRIWLPDDLMGEYGFGNISIVVGGGNILIPEQARLTVQPLGWSLDNDLPTLKYIASGSDITGLARAHRLSEQLLVKRAMGSLALSTARKGDIYMAKGASIYMNTGGAVSFSALAGGDGQAVGTAAIYIDGLVSAPAGRFSAKTEGDVTLGEHADLSLPGWAQVFYDVSTGQRYGEILRGGEVTLQAATQLRLLTGSTIDVSGASGVLDYWSRSQVRGLLGAGLSPQKMGSDGGYISLASASGLIAGNLRTAGADVLARDGLLEVSMVTLPSTEGQGEQLDLKEMLSQLGDPRWYGDYELACAEACDGLEPWELVLDFDWNRVFTQDWGIDAGEPIIFSRDSVEQFYSKKGSHLLTLSNTAQGGVFLAAPVEHGLSASVLSFLLDNVGVDFDAAYKNVPQKIELALRPDTIHAAKLGSLALRVGDNMQIALDNAAINLSGALHMDGPVLQAGARKSALGASYIQLLNSSAQATQTVDALVSGLTLQADKAIDIVAGNAPVLFRGFSEVLLNTGELRFIAAHGNAQHGLQATLDVDGALQVIADKIYPGTAVTARIDAGAAIRIQGRGQFAAPLSAGGSLTLQAPIIENYGSVYAPLGELVFLASQRLVLGQGSLSSVSGSGLLVPYGMLRNNEFWMDPRSTPSDPREQAQLTAPPDKRVLLQAPELQMQAGAVIDLTGGGDLYAWEHVPGSGGSHDLLSLPGMYAILPGLQLPPTEPGSQAGERIWLAGGGSVAAGWYDLLPAHYALLPGAHAIQRSPQSAQPRHHSAISLPDGSALINGFGRNVYAGGQDALASQWRVLPGDLVRRYSEYNESFADEFYASQAYKLAQYRMTGQNVVTPRLARDGGLLVFKATDHLLLDGSLKSQAATGGRGGLVDIAASKIAIVGAAQNASELRSEGYLLVDAASISRFGAASLLVGGTRAGDSLGMALDVTASHLILRNDLSSELYGPEVILAATERLHIDEGSMLSSRGDASASMDLIIQAQETVLDDNATPDDKSDDFIRAAKDWGALVRVSSGEQVRIVRQGEVDIQQGGLIEIGARAVLHGSQALLIDATNTTNMAAGAQLVANALALSSGRIGIGGGSGLVLDATALVQLAQTRALTLHSYSSLDFYRSADLRGFADLTINAAVLQSHTDAPVHLQANRLTLINTGASRPTHTAGVGVLELSAQEFVLGSGDTFFAGVGQVYVNASQRLLGLDSGSLNVGQAALTIKAPLFQGRSGSNQSLHTQSQLSLLQTGPNLDASELARLGLESLGARLTLMGQGVTLAMPILAQGGHIEVNAGTGDLTVTYQARVLAGGVAQQFFDVPQFVGAGQITLASRGGLISLLAGSVLDVAAHRQGGAGGSLILDASAGGKVRLEGIMLATGASGSRGGSFTLSIDQLSDFGSLSHNLNEAGFDHARHFRIREGDITLGGVTRVDQFEVVADEGSIILDSTADIVAQAKYGGSIRLVAGRGLSMHSGAQLRALATDSEDELGSGQITLEALAGQLHLAGGTLDVSGGEGGKIRLRTRRSESNAILDVSALNAHVIGARSLVLEGVRRYRTEDQTVESIKQEAIAHAKAFVAESDLFAKLGAQATKYTLAAGIEITSEANLRLSQDWNLYDSFGDGHREGSLTLRAAGDLFIDAHLSDGFDMADRNGRLLDKASWDLRLVAGADLDSVDALAVQGLPALGVGQGNLRVGTADSAPAADDGVGHLVRTGSGNLTVRAGRDVILAHRESVLYTAGRAESDPTLGAGFTTARRHAQYGLQGGHVDIRAQGSIQAPTQQGARSDQIMTEWLYRQGRLGSTGEYFDSFVIHSGWGQRPDGTWGNYQEYSEHGEQPSWWVNYASFEQGVGALGGGNITVSAGGDLLNLLVALPSTMRVTGGRSESDAAPLVHLRNGGQYLVKANGTIRAGQYYVGRGVGEISAGQTAVGYQLQGQHSNGNFYEYDIAPVLALSDASLTLQTAGQLILQTAIDPLLIRKSVVDPEEEKLSEYYRSSSDMISQTARSSLTLVSIGGDVRLENQAQYITRHTAQVPGMGAGFATGFIGMYPARTTVAALGGSIDLLGLMPVMADQVSDVSMLAAHDLLFASRSGRYEGVFGTGNIIMSLSTRDAIAASTILRPGQSLLGGGMVSSFGLENVFLTNKRYDDIADNPAVLPMYMHDFTPSRFYALSGSVTNLDLIASESVHIRAGQDIRGFALDGRNLRAGDTTIMAAGNDILAMTSNPAQRLMNNQGAYDYNHRVIIQGPGHAILTAGRDVQAGAMQLFTTGNQFWRHHSSSPVSDYVTKEAIKIKGLPEQGASISVMAGVKDPLGYALFEQAYLNPAHLAAMPAYLKTTLDDGSVVPLYLSDHREQRAGLDKLSRRGLVSFVEGVLGQERVAQLSVGSQPGLNPMQAWEQYQVLPAVVRQRFLRQIFMYELREGGRNQNQVDARGQPVNSGYMRGYAAIDTLFRSPERQSEPVRFAQDLPLDWQSDWVAKGNIAAGMMAIRTYMGGDINLFSPGGGLQVAALGATVPDGYGVVTLASPGQINVFAHRDIVMNRSRLLSFVSQRHALGSDQILWATQGDVDAGRGAKTVRLAQAPDMSIDADGNVTVKERLDLSGSGIGTVGEGDVDLIAPGGTVNAGDAGIRVASNMNIAALQVLNVDNIEVQGESTGIPPIVTVNIGALTAASSAATTAAAAAQETIARSREQNKSSQPSQIQVQVLGFGSESSPDAGTSVPSVSQAGRVQTAPADIAYDKSSPVRVLAVGALDEQVSGFLSAQERNNMIF